MEAAIGEDPLLWYEVDSEETIQQIGGAWDRFARENDAPDLTRERLIGRKLWDFIAVPEVRMVYRDLLTRLRRDMGTASFRFRCDSPEKYRLLVMVLTSSATGSIRFLTRIVEERPHEDPGPTAPDPSRVETIVTVCSVCKSLRTPDGWMETGAALKRHTFGLVDGVKLSHGLCEKCVEVLEKELELTPT